MHLPNGFTTEVNVLKPRCNYWFAMHACHWLNGQRPESRAPWATPPLPLTKEKKPSRATAHDPEFKVGKRVELSHRATTSLPSGSIVKGRSTRVKKILVSNSKEKASSNVGGPGARRCTEKAIVLK